MQPKFASVGWKYILLLSVTIYLIGLFNYCLYIVALIIYLIFSPYYRYKEIHLEVQEKYNIWREYVYDMKHIYKEDYSVQYKLFVQIWNDHFPNVKIRQYKQVTGYIFYM